jgi:hypothetical protein
MKVESWKLKVGSSLYSESIRKNRNTRKLFYLNENLENPFPDFNLYQDSRLMLVLPDCKQASIIHSQHHPQH